MPPIIPLNVALPFCLILNSTFLNATIPIIIAKLMNALKKMISAAGMDLLNSFTIIAMKLKRTAEENIITGPLIFVLGMFFQPFDDMLHVHSARAFYQDGVIGPYYFF